jgi:hypothetical protein
MIKEAGFQWSAAMGNLLLCFLPSLLLCLLFLLVSLAEFLYLVSGISAGFLWDFSRIFDYPQKRG